jgi:hypothetical protein
MSPSGPRFALHVAAHSARSLDALSARLSDAVGSLEVGEHEDVEQISAGSRTQGVQAVLQPALKFVGSHGRKATPSNRPSIQCPPHLE